MYFYCIYVLLLLYRLCCKHHGKKVISYLDLILIRFDLDLRFMFGHDA